MKNWSICKTFLFSYKSVFVKVILIRLKLCVLKPVSRWSFGNSGYEHQQNKKFKKMIDKLLLIVAVNGICKKTICGISVG